MTDPKCENCRFYRSESNYGVCRRHAPIAVHDPGLNFGVYPEAFPARWPVVKYYSSCGDHQPITNSPERQS